MYLEFGNNVKVVLKYIKIYAVCSYHIPNFWNNLNKFYGRLGV